MPRSTVPTSRSRLVTVALAAAFLVLLAACGDDDDSAVTTDPTDTAPDDGVDQGGTTDPEQARAEAKALLGVSESELPDDVRIGRRGDEQFMLTEDYVIGRRTVELDEVDGEFVVVSVTVELPDGPETFTS